MSLYSTAVKKPITTALCFVAVVVIGLFSLTRLSIDLLPNIETNTIMVLTSYPGASTADIETNVTKIMENTLNTVSDLKDISSQSKENLSIVTLEFEYGTDIDVATNDVRDKIDMIRSTLPDNAGTPVPFPSRAHPSVKSRSIATRISSKPIICRSRPSRRLSPVRTSILPAVVST